MAEIYGTTGIPGQSAEVRSGGTVAISAAFERTVGLVGGMDTASGSATSGDVVTVESSADAADLFGEPSELKRQVDLAFANGAGTVYAAPVSETETTETFSSQSGGVLSNTPVLDPNVQPEHDITETGGVAVNIVYGTPSTPTEADTINLNPVTGEFEADASGTYDITHSYGDYSSAITEVVTKVPRIVGVCTEAPSLGNDVLTELNSLDVDFQFSHGIVGAGPEVVPSSYTDAFDDRRMVRTAASRGYLDAAEQEEVRVVGAVAGRAAGKALGDSLTAETLQGIVSLRTSYTNSEAADLIDQQVMPIQQRGGAYVVKDMTTSTDSRFERLYASEIVDEATEISHLVSEDFVSRRNTGENRSELESSHRSSYSEMVGDNLLEAFFVDVRKGDNDFEVDVNIGLDVVGIIDTIDVTITVGDVVTNGGAA